LKLAGPVQLKVIMFIFNTILPNISPAILHVLFPQRKR